MESGKWEYFHHVEILIFLHNEEVYIPEDKTTDICTKLRKKLAQEPF